LYRADTPVFGPLEGPLGGLSGSFLCGVRFSRRAGSTTPLGVPSSRTHAIMTPPMCSIRDRMRWVRSCGRARCGRSPRQSPVPPRPTSVRRFRILILARQRLRSWALPLVSDVHCGLGYPTRPPSPVDLSVLAIWPFWTPENHPRFWQQIRPHARTIAPTHKRTLTHASTPPTTRANALTNASRKHTHARTPRRRKSPTRPQTRHARPTRPQTHAPTPTTCHGDAINARARVCMCTIMPHAQTH